MSNKKYKSKYERLANQPVKSLISSLAAPTILTMLVSALYNMADSYFVGKIDTTSVASVGIVFSIMTLLQAVGFFFGNGSGIVISKELGRKNRSKAAIYASTAFFTAVGIGVALAICGFFFSEPLARLLGATSTTIKSASGYLKIILLGSPFILGSFVMNNHLRYQGSAVYSMMGIVSGGIINILLDPLFIFSFKLGVKGAALATIISQAIGFVILLLGTHKNDNIRFSLKSFKFSNEVYVTIIKNGLPSLARQGINTIANITMNFACAPFGDAAVAGMSVFNRLMFLGFAVTLGFGQGYQPVCSFNNGAKRYDRVYDGYKFTAIVTTAIITAFAILSMIFAPQMIAVFRDDADVVQIGARALRFQCMALPIVAFSTLTTMLMQSLEISGKATILSLSRQGIFYIPLMLLLPKLFGVTGIQIVQPIAEYLSLALTLILATKEIKRLKGLSDSIKNKSI